MTKKEIESKISKLHPSEALNELYKIRESQEANVDQLILSS